MKNKDFEIKEGVLVKYHGQDENVVIPDTVTTIGENAFYNCWGLKSIDIPNSVTSIADYAFRGCRGLTSVTIPNSVTSIGYSAFYRCWGLKSIDIPNSLTSIGNYAFHSCIGLTSITIPNSVTSIGDYAFSDCNNLNYNEHDNALYLGNSDNPYLALVKAKSTNIASCEINPNCRFICSDAFSGCSGLTSIEIPNSVTSIGDGAFYNCWGLKSIDIPNSVTSIGGSAFINCSSLTLVTIPNSVTSIGYYSFTKCKKIKLEKTKKLVAYKAFEVINDKLQCRDFIYEEGKSYKEENAILCECGFHACLNPLDIFGYYKYAEGKTEIHEVILSGEMDIENNKDTKVCATEITIGRKLNWEEISEIYNKLSVQ